MLNFIRVFCFLLFLGLGLGLGLGIDNLKNIFKIFDRWRCKHVGHSLSLDACMQWRNFYLHIFSIKVFSTSFLPLASSAPLPRNSITAPTFWLIPKCRHCTGYNFNIIATVAFSSVRNKKKYYNYHRQLTVPKSVVDVSHRVFDPFSS